MPTLTAESGLRALSAGNGQVDSTQAGWSLGIPAGPAGKYRLAQIDDYHGLSRRDFRWRAPLSLSLKARVSGDVNTGTWGFGLWNNPFGFALSPFGQRLMMPTAPQAAWFFWASPASYLSFRDDLPANGMLTQAFRSKPGWRWLPAIALAQAFRRQAARRMLRRRVSEDSWRLNVGLRSWHAYGIRWSEQAVEYLLDGEAVFKTGVAPRPPLGVVIWIDNQFAAFEPAGRIAWGFEKTVADSSLEISDLQIEAGS